MVGLERLGFRDEPQTTNLGVRSSNLFGRAIFSTTYRLRFGPVIVLVKQRILSAYVAYCNQIANGGYPEEDIISTRNASCKHRRALDSHYQHNGENGAGR